MKTNQPKYIDFEPNYEKHPKTDVSELGKVLNDNQSIINEIQSLFDNENNIIAIECYPGVSYSQLIQDILDNLADTTIINIDNYSLSEEEINTKLKDQITDDRVFGHMTNFTIKDLYDEQVILQLSKKIIESNTKTIVYGFGASVLLPVDQIIYVDITRWEIQKRYRSQELGNWQANNYALDTLRKYKRAYFIEWRIADKVKDIALAKSTYYIDGNASFKMVETTKLFSAMEKLVKSPFRLVPYFDPGVWGGQWMKEVCNLDKSKENFAWSFDGVPEENSIMFSFLNDHLEIPAINVVFFYSKELMGEKVVTRFGREFPIRFDFLDTVEGQNLSLQVHPTTDYIQRTFGMHYTQDESYYILYAEENANVYLGLRENIDKKAMIDDLRKANKGGIIFDAEKYVNKFPAKKHDHFLIPAGTVHCSGSNTMVLEISATPYIFTFKLWDWGRLGLDGLPRPVHVEHGKNVIQFDRTTSWVEENLVNNIDVLQEEPYLIERTGLHELEFIETKRYWFDSEIVLHQHNTVSMCNLVEGEAIKITSLDNSFEPYIVHYAETFILPAQLEQVKIEPLVSNQKVAIIRATVR